MAFPGSLKHIHSPVKRSSCLFSMSMLLLLCCCCCCCCC